MPVIWDKEKDPNRTRSQATTPLANLWVNALFGILANQREWHSISSRDKCPRCLDSMKETMNMYNWAVAGQQIDGALCTPFNLKYSSLLMICNSQSKVASFKNKICSCLNKCRMPTRMYTEASFLCRRSTHAYALSIPRVHYVVVSLRCLFNFCSGETRGGGGWRGVDSKAKGMDWYSSQATGPLLLEAPKLIVNGPAHPVYRCRFHQKPTPRQGYSSAGWFWKWPLCFM